MIRNMAARNLFGAVSVDVKKYWFDIESPIIMTGSFFSTLFLSAMTSDENYVFTHTHSSTKRQC